jgi:hypothetical protein
MTLRLRHLAVFALVAAALPGPARAACTPQDFSAAVDQSGAALRALNGEFQPKLKDRMRRFKDAKGLTEAAYEDAALDSIQDARLGEFDAHSGELILKVDTMGRAGEGAAPDCAKLNDIKAASAELLAVIRAKSGYMLTALDAKISEAEAAKSAGNPQAAAKEPVKQPEPQAKPPSRADAKAVDPKAVPSKDAAGKDSGAKDSTAKTWSAKTVANDAYRPPAAGEPVAEAPAATPFMTPEDDGYSIDEIQDATKGFFGTVSTSLAGVLEHAFKISGRPTGYVLGKEGGGAFLAGLRYGSGTLYMRHQAGTRQVYWHGPSLGYDIGAEGGRTMFLIYRLPEPDGLYGTYGGIDGSAYVIGGVGITFLKGGDVIMAPIRSGLGLRLGANIGYVRFTDSPTWNPF